MQQKIIDGIPVEMGSSNVFADLEHLMLAFASSCQKLCVKYRLPLNQARSGTVWR